jgi:type I restriction enzyme M protein
MLGAIIGDIAGSRFEWDRIKTKEFDFLTQIGGCEFTDDSVMTAAIAKAILDCNGDYSNLGNKAVYYMQNLGKQYPNAGYGGKFSCWITSSNPQPYNSYGNGSAMRVSPCAYAANTLDEAIDLSKAVTEVTHNHPEGIKGAEATTVAIFLALHGKSILEIRDYIDKHYYPMNFTLDSIRDSYTFNESCQETVPQAIMAFLESTSYEDAVRNAVSLGGDSDTLAAITGSIAEAYYGIPVEIRKLGFTFLDAEIASTVNRFEAKFGIRLEKKLDNFAHKESHSTSKKAENLPLDEMSREEQIALAVEITDTAVEEEKIRTMRASELHSFLYAACTILYGAVLPSKYKTYVLPLMFLKRVCDCYDEEIETAKQKYGADWVDFDEDEIHRFMIPTGCHWSDIRNCAENVGSAILNSMQGIEAANPGTLSGLFTGFDEADWTNKSTLPDKKLKDLVEHFSERNLGNENYDADIMGDANEYLIRHFADDDNKNAGDFFTPRTIVKLLIKMLAPETNHSIYDPACGTGGMLIEYIRQTHSKTGAGRFIYGQENMTSTSAIARMNLYLHGIEDFHIKTGDTLRNPQFIYRGQLQKFDYVVANAPFGLSGWGAEQFETDVWGRNIWGCPTDSSADFAWIQHIVTSMKEKTGRAAVIMPQGVLFHGGKEGKIREELVKSHKLEAVINLPSGVFYSTGVSACVLFLNNSKPAEWDGKVILIDAGTIVHARRAQKYMDDGDVETVYNLFSHFEDMIDFAKVVTEEDIADKGFTLAVNTYIEKTPPKPIDPKEVKANYLNAYQEVIACEEKLKTLLKNGGYIE